MIPGFRYFRLLPLHRLLPLDLESPLHLYFQQVPGFRLPLYRLLLLLAPACLLRLYYQPALSDQLVPELLCFLLDLQSPLPLYFL